MKTLTNTQLVRKHERLVKRMNKLTDKFINAGLGHLRPTDMRERPDCKLSRQYIKLLDQCANIRIEAESRYGPGLMYVGQLLNVRRKRV